MRLHQGRRRRWQLRRVSARPIPQTAKLLDEMAKPVASTLGTAYWSCVPFAFGAKRFVKYKLEPTIDVDPITDPPSDPTYLAADLRRRLKAGEARFRFMRSVQHRSGDHAARQGEVRWDEAVSPPIHVADLVLPQQDITARGQAEYGENLAWNIWRVTEDHEPQGIDRRGPARGLCGLRRAATQCQWRAGRRAGRAEARA